MNRLRALLISCGVAFLAGALAGAASLLFYRILIVPRLPLWQEVPALWWAGAFSPYVVAIVLLGRSLRSPFFAPTDGLAFILGSAAMAAAWSRLGSPAASAGGNGPASFFAVLGALIAGTLMAASALLLVWWAAGLVGIRRAPAPPPHEADSDQPS